MKIATALSSLDFGNLGTFTIWDDFGNKELVPLPDTVNTLVKGPDFPMWRRGDFSRLYVLGGHTDNLVFTEHKWLLRIGINAPSAPFVTPGPPIENQVGVVAAAGGGLTGSCVFAFRFLDTLHFRRSPLGAASPAVVLAGQGATFSNVPAAPVPADPCVNKIEIYVSVDGGLFRHWATRDIGAATFTVNETTTGEAYTEELTQYPKLAFGDLNLDRMFSAGDPRHPERIYVSQVGNPEEYTGLFLTTKNGEPVIGLKNIGGSTIYVQCPNSCYYIQGFNEADLVMKTLKPKIGGFGQRTIALVGDVALIPTQLGWYRCDGTSMVPIGVGDWDSTWRKSVDGIERPSYENGFAVTDYASGVIRFVAQNLVAQRSENPAIIGFPTFETNTYWVVNFAGLVPELGGSGRADLSFDLVGGYMHTTAAFLYDPDAKVGALYTGNYIGDILIENQAGKVDRTDDGAGGTAPIPKRFIIHTPHYGIGPVASDDDAFQVTDAWMNYQCENLESTIGIYAGNEYAWQAADLNAQTYKAPEEYAVPAGRSGPADFTVSNSYVPRDMFLISSLAQSTGSCVSMRLTVTQSEDAQNPNQRQTIDQRSEVVFNGWGFVAEPGVERQPIGPYIPD